MTKTNLVIGITFSAFLIEALFHYQLGAWQDDGPIQFPQIVLPDTKDFISMVAIVAGADPRSAWASASSTSLRYRHGCPMWP